MLFRKQSPKNLVNYLLIGPASYLLHSLMSNSLHSGLMPANPWIPKPFLHKDWSLAFEYLVFMLIVVLINFTLKFLQREKVDDIECLSAIKATKKGSRFWKSLIIYSFLYCFFTSIQKLFMKDFFSNSNIIMALNHDVINLNQESLFFPSRMLEEETQTAISTTSQALNPSISLPIGRVLSSLGMTASHVILSKDSRTAFVSLDRSGGIKIVDISNLENPIITNSLKLVPVEYPFLGKVLALSHDEKTLFASNMHRLEIIDVSNLEMPVILGQFEDENITKLLQDRRMTNYVLDYRVSMALSRDSKIIFIGGMGLQVIDISDLRKPTLISSNSQELSDDHLLLTQIQISNNGEELFIANGSLSIYNATNPKNLTLLGSYSVPYYSISSIVLSKKNSQEVAFLVATAANQTVQGMIFEKINISNPSNPTTLESNPFQYKTYGTPYILAVGLDENIAFIQVWDGLISQDVGIFDLFQKEFKIGGGDASLIKKATSLVVLPGDESKIIIAQNSQKLSTIQFDTNFPNKRIFSFSKNPLGSLITRTDLAIDSSILTADGKTLIVKRGFAYAYNGVLEIVNVSNYSNPVLLTLSLRYISQIWEVLQLKSQWDQ